MSKTQELGKNGEEIVATYLERNGYRILEKNFRCKFGEIDLIAKKKGVLSFIEVKTRKKITYGTPAEAVNYIKKKHMYKTSEYYILKNNVGRKDITLDVVEVYFYSEKDFRIIHIKRAIEDCPL